MTSVIWRIYVNFEVFFCWNFQVRNEVKRKARRETRTLNFLFFSHRTKSSLFSLTYFLQFFVCVCVLGKIKKSKFFSKDIGSSKSSSDVRRIGFFSQNKILLVFFTEKKRFISWIFCLFVCVCVLRKIKKSKFCFWKIIVGRKARRTYV